MKLKWKKVIAWDKTVLYQVTNGHETINVEIETIKDGIGQLKRVITTYGDFETYGMKNVKLKVAELFTTKFK